MHARKRQFQPPIDSFFARADRDQFLAQSASSNPSNQPSNSRPELPAHVQSSLLSVGMRVRKAVPEGYKTHKTALFGDPSPALTRAVTAGGIRESSVSQRELLPYCGLHKVGGLGVQDLGTVDALGETDIFEDPEIGSFLSSQESTNSTLSTDSAPTAKMGTSHKRTFSRIHHGEEDEDWDGFDPVDFQISDLDMDLSSRQYAQPKRRQRAQDSREALANPLTDSRNTLDWEEAGFLEPWDQQMEGT